MILSLLIILAVGMLVNKVFTRLKLPGLLGMIIAGILVGPYGLGLLDDSLLRNATDIRMLALVVILLRAGLGLEKEMLKRVGWAAIKMSAIPCLMEGFAVMWISHRLLGLPWVEAGILGFVLAAVSPAVVVPSMLALKEQRLGEEKGVPVIILAGASVDDVFAITLFTTFLSMAMQAGQPLLGQVAQIPLRIVGGILLGALLGWLLHKLDERVHMSDMGRLGLVIIAALAALLLGEELHLAGLLGVMTLGFVLLEKANGLAAKVDGPLNKIWFFAQIFLFVLIGAETNVAVAWQAGLAGLAIIAVGLSARSLGVMIALQGSALNAKEKLFCAIAYMPKATVQAAIGGIPLAMGIPSGMVILAIAVLAVMITASLGSWGIKVGAPHLLEQAGDGAKPQTAPARHTATLPTADD